MLCVGFCNFLLLVVLALFGSDAQGCSHARRDGNGTSDPADTYDYIVVGSGPGGGVVASNLALAGHSVLLIEAGRDASDDITTTVAALTYPSTPTLKWHFFVRHLAAKDGNNDEKESEQELQFNHLTWTLPNGSYWVGSGARAPKDATLNGVYYPRGATLGGSAVVNAMATVLANDADWDYVANITGDESWSSSRMRDIFEKIEKNHYLPKGTPGHGFDGFMDTRLGSPEWYRRSPGTLSFLGALAGGLLGLNGSVGVDELLPLMGKDPNSDARERDLSTGPFGLPIHTTSFGKRWTPRDLILSTLNATEKDGCKSYPLKLQLESLATRILFDDDSRNGTSRNSKPQAVGVEFLVGSMAYGASWQYNTSNPVQGKLQRAYARREVIVSGGAFNSPQILQLSGIGDRNHLQSLGIPVVAHVPGVGLNLQDNQELPVVGHGAANFIPAPDPAAAKCTRGAPGDPCLAAWRRGEGPYAGPQGNSECGMHKTAHSPDGRRDLLTFSSPGPVFRGFWPPTNQTDTGLFMDPPNTYSRSMVRMSPQPPSSRAGVRITSRDPTVPPAIRFEHFPGSLENDNDVGAMLDTVALVRRTFAAMPAPFGPVAPVEPPCPAGVLPSGHCREREQDAAWVRSQAFGHHASGTCRIGRGNLESKCQDPLAVLDSRFRVRGVRGLRVVDASVFPRQPGAFPVLATVMVGQKASEVIVQDL